MNPALAWAAVAGAGLGLGLWSLVSLAPRMRRPRLGRRIAPYLLGVSAEARELLRPSTPGPLSVFSVFLEPLTSAGGRALGRLLGGSELAARRIRQSGSTITVAGLRAQQLGWAAIGCAACAAISVVAGTFAGLAVPLALALPVFGAVAGVVGREYALQRAAKQRLARLATELPVTLEFLTLSLSAGEGILDAIRRVAAVSKGELANELTAVLAAVNSGLPFGETISQLALDLDLPPFSRFIDQLVGALDRGSPLADVLRAQSQDARDESKRQLLELAGKKELAMLFPLVFLILPVTIAFAIFPGIFVLQVGF